VSTCASSSFVQVYETLSPYVSGMSCVIGDDRTLVLKVKEISDALRAHRKATPVNSELTEELESSPQAAKADRIKMLKNLATTLKGNAMLAAAMSEPARVQPIVACMAERHKELVDVAPSAPRRCCTSAQYAPAFVAGAY
jgi:Lon protease-like protein